MSKTCGRCPNRVPDEVAASFAEVRGLPTNRQNLRSASINFNSFSHSLKKSNCEMTGPVADQTLDGADARARLLSTFSTPPSEHGKGWSKLWDEGDFLPWDKGTPNPALLDILTDRRDLIGPAMVEEGSSTRKMRALVPGCGRGYDVLLLASFGYDAYGLEISESAVKRCEEEKRANGAKYSIKDEKVGAGETKFIVGDFFADTWLKEVEGAGKFELIYDYTVHYYPIPTLELVLHKNLPMLPQRTES